MPTSNKMEPTDTPETDHALHGIWYRGDHGSAIPALCRKLERERDALAKRIQEWTDLSDYGLRLRLGEMTASEIRCIRAVLSSLVVCPDGTKCEKSCVQGHCRKLNADGVSDIVKEQSTFPEKHLCPDGTACEAAMGCVEGYCRKLTRDRIEKLRADGRGIEAYVLKKKIEDFEKWNSGNLHDSDCAIHREPAYPAGPCDCGALDKTN